MITAKNRKKTLVFIPLILSIVNCTPMPELSREEIAFRYKQNENSILQETEFIPGSLDYEQGVYGGTYEGLTEKGMKSLNLVNAHDGSTTNLLSFLYPSFMEYDSHKKEWVPGIASATLIESSSQFINENRLSEAEIKIIQKIPEEGMGVIYSINIKAKWFIPETGEIKPITSQDPVFWYNEIDGDERFQSTAYASQFMQMADGTEKRIEVIALNRQDVLYILPKKIAEPIYSTDANFGPAFIYKTLKESFSEAEKGKNRDIQAIKELFPIGSNARLLPTAGPFYLDEYSKDVRMHFKRNPHYYKKDKWGNPLPYLDGIHYRFIKSEDAQQNEFFKGAIDVFGIASKKLDLFIQKQKLKKQDFTIYNAGASLSSSFISLNQNPKFKERVSYQWMIQKEFRQAISCLINRQRIIDTIYRGLADPAIYFFSTPNYMFDPKIHLQYRYDPQRAIELLAQIGITPNDQGKMMDLKQNLIEFELIYQSDTESLTDMINIIIDEAARIGIKITGRPVDFYAIVDSLMTSYDWEALNLQFTGSNMFPTAGSNVWQSWGNLHMWHPLQENPATPWEARMDELYNKGDQTLNRVEAKPIWDEYQQIMLEQLPLIYLVYPYRFAAFNNRLGNVRYDAMNEKAWFYSEAQQLYIKPEYQQKEETQIESD